jgi:hypothetical protein
MRCIDVTATNWTTVMPNPTKFDRLSKRFRYREALTPPFISVSPNIADQQDESIAKRHMGEVSAGLRLSSANIGEALLALISEHFAL